MNVLFVLDKWCHGLKRNGISAWESNFVSSYKELYPTIKVTEFNFDFQRFANGPSVNLNDKLINLIHSIRPNFIFLVIYELPNDSDTIISVDSLRRIKNLGVPIVTIFGDLEHKAQCRIVKFIEPYCDLIYYTALVAPGNRLKIPRLHYVWVPKDPRYFHSNHTGYKRSIDISYLGTPKGDRVKVINYLRQCGVNIYSNGGERTGNIGLDEYTNILRDSKISLSFSRADGNHVTNARTFEVIACGAMLLEQEGLETPRLFKPFVDYVPFYNKADLLDKVRYYTLHNVERDQIVRSATQRYNRFYTAQRFWNEINEKYGCIQLPLKFHSVTDKSSPLDEFWSLEHSNRKVPKFDRTIYDGVSPVLILKYSFLNRIAEVEALNRLHKFLLWCVQLPNRIIVKIYLKFIKKW